MRHFLSLFIAAALPAATTVFYNGDYATSGPNGGNYLDCNNCRGSGLFVYDNFSVNSTAITLTEIYGTWIINNVNAGFIPTAAYWAIRTGVSQGVDGVLVASGFGSLATTSLPVLPGWTSFAFFQGTITGLNVVLNPGEYWLTISPTALQSGSAETFLVGTNGANAVNGTLDGQSYVRGPYWPGMQSLPAYLQPFTGQGAYDWSYGARGGAVLLGWLRLRLRQR